MRLLPLTLLLTVLPAATASAGWSADHVQTRAGLSSGVHAAGGNGDRVALTWERTLGGTRRAELRLGRARDGFTRAPAVLDSSAHAVFAPLPTYVRAGAFAFAWERYEGGNQRIRYRVTDAAGHLGASVAATSSGASALLPAWTPGATPVLSWTRATRADAVELATAGPRGVRLPAAPRSEPGLASGADGLTAVSWVFDGQVLVRTRRADGFGTPAVLATGEVNTTRAVRVGTATLVLWRQDTNLMVAARADDASAFGPRVVLASTTDAPQVAVTGTGEVLALAPVGDSSFVGELQLARLGSGGAPLGAVRSLGRGRRAQLVADGTGSAFAAWMAEDASRAVMVRRIAPGGILGAPRVLAEREDVAGSPALGATREGGAVLAWVAGGRVHARTYRP